MLDISLVANTKRMYDRAWQVFQQFHKAMFGMTSHLPLTPKQVTMFVAYMDMAGHAQATVCTYVSALSHAHKLADLVDPTVKFWVKKVVDAAGTQAKKPTTRKPITLTILDKNIQVACWALPRYNASLMRVVFSLALHACARMGEMISSNGQPQHAVMA